MILEIEPPFDSCHEESFTADAVHCPECMGTGGVPAPRDFLGFDPYETDTCQRCGGSGRLTATVHVKWHTMHEMKKNE